MSEVLKSPTLERPANCPRADCPLAATAAEALRIKQNLQRELADRIYEPEYITDPESPSLVEFYKLLERNFRPGEIEPLEVYKKELARGGFICIVLRDPIFADRRIVSGTYASVYNGILAKRFTLTDCKYAGIGPTPEEDTAGHANFRGYRGTGVSQQIDMLLLKKAHEMCTAQGSKLTASVCESVDRSERYRNNFSINKRQNGMRRLYFQTEEGQYKQMYYRLPPLAWNRDGTPASQEIITENLQIAAEGCDTRIPIARIKRILISMWENWYIRPQEDFENEEAFIKHRDEVMRILEQEIFAPLDEYGHDLTFLTKTQREGMEESGNAK